MSSKELFEAFFDCSNQNKAMSLLSQYSSTVVKMAKGSKTDSTLLHQAAARGWTKACQVLTAIEEYEVDTDCKAIGGYTPLHWTCTNNHIDTIMYLLGSGYSDPLIKIDTGSNITPFAVSKRSSQTLFGRYYHQAPDPNDVFNFLRNTAFRWDDVGRELLIPFEYREELRTEGIQSTPANKLERILMKWVESECSDVTWSKVIQVLSILQFNDLMESTKLFLKRDDILNKY